MMDKEVVLDTKTPRSVKVIFRLTPEEHRILMSLAKAENRSLANYVSTIVRKTITLENHSPATTSRFKER